MEADDFRNRRDIGDASHLKRPKRAGRRRIVRRRVFCRRTDRFTVSSTTRRSVWSSAFATNMRCHGQRDHREAITFGDRRDGRPRDPLVPLSSILPGLCSGGLCQVGCEELLRQVSGSYLRQGTSPRAMPASRRLARRRRLEAWLDGHNGAVVFFGGVPPFDSLRQRQVSGLAHLVEMGRIGNERDRLGQAFRPMTSSRTTTASYFSPRLDDKGNVEGVVGSCPAELR